MEQKFWIVWNEARSEGFITDCAFDASAVLTGEKDYSRGYPSSSTVGDAFREAYEDDEMTVECVTLDLVCDSDGSPKGEDA